MEEKPDFKVADAESFSDFLIDTLNKSALSFMLSLGHRSGLFGTMSQMDYATSAEIATRARLNERYVREWLSAMVTSGVVNFIAENKLYRLPIEHAAFLTRKAGANNLAMAMQNASVMGEVEDEILKCFKEGGGVPYSKFHRFHEVMAEESGQVVLPVLQSHILPLIPGLTEKLQAGIKVLDIGCGSGRVINKLASHFPLSHFTGMDLSSEAIENGLAEATRLNLKNVEFILQDLSDFDETAPVEKFDFITTFDSVHDQGQPLRVLKGIYRALKADGVYLMQDVNGTSHLEEDKSHPLGTYLYTVSCMHCMTVSLAQNVEGLEAMWGEALTKDYVKKAGFSYIETHQLAHDLTNNWYVIKK